MCRTLYRHLFRFWRHALAHVPKWLKTGVLLGVLLTATLPLEAQRTLRSTQRTFEPRILGGLQLMGQWPNLVGSAGRASGFPFLGLGFDVGGSLTYRDRLGLAVQGSALGQGFILCSNGDCLDIYHLMKRLEARASWTLYSIDLDGNFLRVGLGWGLSVQNSYESESEQGRSVFRFSEPTQTRPYLVPEIGVVSPAGRQRTEFALRYVMHLDRTVAWTMVANNPAGNATFTATNDHVAFTVRWYFGFKKKPQPVLPQLRLDQSARTVEQLDTLTTKRDRLVLWLSDNAEYDGDTLSVLLNSHPVLVAHELTKTPHKVVLYLDRRVNTLTVLAHNEGRVPPNTALCTVRTGHGRKTLMLRSGLKSSQAVTILRESGLWP